MPSSWSESNRLHSSNKREESALDEYQQFLTELHDEIVIDDLIEDTYDNAFSRFDEPEDRYLDASYEDRYYEPELDFDIY